MIRPFAADCRVKNPSKCPPNFFGVFLNRKTKAGTYLKGTADREAFIGGGNKERRQEGNRKARKNEARSISTSIAVHTSTTAGLNEQCWLWPLWPLWLLSVPCGLCGLCGYCLFPVASVAAVPRGFWLLSVPCGLCGCCWLLSVGCGLWLLSVPRGLWLL